MHISSAINSRKSLGQHRYRKFHLPNINRNWGAAERSSGHVWKGEEGGNDMSWLCRGYITHIRLILDSNRWAGGVPAPAPGDLDSSLSPAPNFLCSLFSPYLYFLICKINEGGPTCSPTVLPALAFLDALICQVGQSAAVWPTGKCDHGPERHTGRWSPSAIPSVIVKDSLSQLLGFATIFRYRVLPGSSVGRSSNSEPQPRFNQCDALVMSTGLLWRIWPNFTYVGPVLLSHARSEDMGSQLPSLLPPQPMPLGHFSCRKCAWLRLATPEAWFRPLKENLACSLSLSHPVPPCPTRMADLGESCWLAGLLFAVKEGSVNVIMKPLVMTLSGLLFCMYWTHLQILS